MTSIEALEKMLDELEFNLEFNYVWEGMREEFEQIAETIKKDLKVLDIIKKHKLLNYVIKNMKCAQMYHLANEEIEKIKEWLENGKE